MDGIYGCSLCLENGAVASMVTGTISYIALHFYNEAYGYLLGIHTVVLPVILKLIAYVAFSFHQENKISILNCCSK